MTMDTTSPTVTQGLLALPKFLPPSHRAAYVSDHGVVLLCGVGEDDAQVLQTRPEKWADDHPLSTGQKVEKALIIVVATLIILAIITAPISTLMVFGWAPGVITPATIISALVLIDLLGSLSYRTTPAIIRLVRAWLARRGLIEPLNYQFQTQIRINTVIHRLDSLPGQPAILRTNKEQPVDPRCPGVNRDQLSLADIWNLADYAQLLLKRARGLQIETGHLEHRLGELFTQLVEMLAEHLERQATLAQLDRIIEGALGITDDPEIDRVRALHEDTMQQGRAAFIQTTDTWSELDREVSDLSTQIHHQRARHEAAQLLRTYDEGAPS